MPIPPRPVGCQEQDEAQGVASLLDRGPLAALALGLSISIDELAIGFTLGLLRVPVVVVIIVIAVRAFGLAQLGLSRQPSQRTSA